MPVVVVQQKCLHSQWCIVETAEGLADCGSPDVDLHVGTFTSVDRVAGCCVGQDCVKLAGDPPSEYCVCVEYFVLNCRAELKKLFDFSAPCRVRLSVDTDLVLTSMNVYAGR